MLAREENITEFSNNLNLTFDWFNTRFTEVLSKTFSEFWACPVETRLVGISENTNFLAQGEEFFVTKIRLNKELSVFVRLSKTLVKNILERTLGSNGNKFNIEKITDLEARILTSFDDYLYRNINENIKQAKDLPQNNTNYNECNLTFFLRTEDMTLGKIVIKLPVVAIKPEKLTLGEETFSISNFLSQSTKVTLKVGSTRLRLNDVKSMEIDDIVVLENSSSSVMELSYRDYVTEVRVAPNPAIMIDSDFDYNGESPKGDIMAGSDMYNMWDSIQVDIDAEFEKVKLTLGELKQITEGLVVDIGSIYNNRIDLKVENKIVASGELVIINDRYGVQIKQVFTENPIDEVPLLEQSEQYEETPEEQENLQAGYDEMPQDSQYEEEPMMQQDDEEDFDYSNFDVDDDDL